MKYGNRPPNYFKKIIHSQIMIVILLIICFILVKATWNIYQKTKITDERLSRTMDEIKKIEDRHKILSSKVSALSTDAGVEAEMRTKYRATKEGELVAVIVDEKKNTDAATVSVADRPSFWQKIIGYFGIGN